MTVYLSGRVAALQEKSEYTSSDSTHTNKASGGSTSVRLRSDTPGR